MYRALVGATLAVAVVGATVLAQSTPPAAASAPLTPILGGKKFTPPVKGDASIDFLPAPTRREGTGAAAVLVTKFQVKNTSNAPIARLKIVETWYDKEGGVIPGGEATVNGLLQPGEIQSLEIRTPVNLKMAQSKLQFVHANGGIPKPHRVAKFDGEDTKEPAAKSAAATKPAPKKKK